MLTTTDFAKEQGKLLEIDRVFQDRGDEYLQIKILRNGNLHGYGVLDISYEQGKASNKHRHFFTFPETHVRQHQIIQLHSGKHPEGKKYEKEAAHHSVHTIHHFYLGGGHIWNDGYDRARIIKYSVEDERNVR